MSTDATDQPQPMDIVLISTADWDNPFWTNKQHVAVQLAKLGHRVFYIESQGLRAPTATGRDLSRIVKRLKRGMRPPRQVRDNIWVWSPIVIPFQGSAAIRRINRQLLRAGLRLWTSRLKHRRELIWTYSPLTTRFYDLEAPKGVVYHAVDAIDAQPGMPAATIREAEAELAGHADLVFTTAHEIQARLSRLNPNTHYFSNVADWDHFSQARVPGPALPEDLAAIPAPRIIFVGAISAYKLDTALVARLAELEPGWSFVLIGDVGEGDPRTSVPELYERPNIHLIGPRAYDRLPQYLAGAAAAIIPAVHNKYTVSMFPMKFFEYLAAGVPVIATKLPALRDYAHVAAFSDEAEGFRDRLAEAIAGDAPPLEQRLAAAKEQTYETRTRKMMALVKKLRPGTGRG